MNELKALGIKKVTFVTDNGYFSELNIGEMLGQGYNFITLGDVDSKWIELEIDKYYKTVQNIIYACPFDLDTHGFTCSITRNFVWTRITPSKTKKLKAGDGYTSVDRWVADVKEDVLSTLVNSYFLRYLYF